MNTWLLHKAAKPAAFLLGLLPALWLVYGAAFDQLGANPAEALVRSTGDWTLRMLCAVLAVTPLRVSAGLPGLARFRRMVGLFVYFYATLHLLAYSWFDMGLDAGDIARDIAKRPFILVGFTAVLLLTPGFVSDLFALFLLLVPNRAIPQTAVATPAPGPKTVDGEFRRVE